MEPERGWFGIESHVHRVLSGSTAATPQPMIRRYPVSGDGDGAGAGVTPLRRRQRPSPALPATPFRIGGGAKESEGNAALKGAATKSSK